MNWQTRTPKPEQHTPFTHVSCPLAPTIAKIRHTRYSFWKRNLSHNSLSCLIPSVSLEKLALSRLARCELPRLRRHGHSLLFSLVPLPTQDKTEGKFLLQRLRTPSAGCNSPHPGLPRI